MADHLAPCVQVVYRVAMEGEKLGKYEIRRTLGRGAMGVVYEGWDPVIARKVAIKTVTRASEEDAEAREGLARFQREAQAAGRLQHPNIVGVFDYGETASLAYIVMEFVDGESLKTVLDRGERFPLAETVRILEELLNGLGFSHERGVVHRDIKPANIIMTHAGGVKIADFGIARIESSSMTQAGTVLGTPSYMSPEQFKGEPVDARTDIYSAGVVLYQLLTGEKPFEGSVSAIMHKVLTTTPPKPSDLAVTAAPPFDAVVAKAMAKRPEERFASASAFAEAIRSAFAGGKEAVPAAAEGEGTVIASATTTGRAERAAPPAAPLSPAAAQRSRLPVWIGAAVAIIVVIGGGLWFFTSRPAPKPAVVASTGTTPATTTPAARASPAPTAGEPPHPAPARINTAAAPAHPSAESPAPIRTSAGSPSSNPPPATAPRAKTPGATVAMTSPASPAPQPSSPGPASSSAPAAAAPPPAVAPASPPQSPAPAAPETSAASPAPAPKPASPAPAPQPLSTATAAQPATPAATPPPPAPSSSAAQPASPPVPLPAPPPPATEATSTAPPPAQPAQSPPVVANIAASPEAISKAVASAIAPIPCSLVSGTVASAGSISLAGLAGEGAPAALHQALSDAAPQAAINWKITTFKRGAAATYCQVLDLLRPIAAPFGASGTEFTLGLQSGKVVLADGDPIAFRLAMPDFPAWLTVDYFASDGSVAHLDPGPGNPARVRGAGAEVLLHGTPPWTVGPPFGRDMIVAIASTKPLFTTARPESEQASAYLAALATALDTAQSAGERLDATAFLLETHEKKKP